MITTILYTTYVVICLALILLVLTLPQSSSGAGNFSSSIMDKYFGGNTNIPILQKVIMALFVLSVIINVGVTSNLHKTNKLQQLKTDVENITIKDTLEIKKVEKRPEEVKPIIKDKKPIISEDKKTKGAMPAKVKIAKRVRSTVKRKK